MVIVFDAHAAVTPVGNPVAVPIPVAPAVVWVIFVSAVLIHNVGVDEAAVTVFSGVTVTFIFEVPMHPLIGCVADTV